MIDRLIGLNGYAQTGKDSVAAILVESFGFERRAFADPLRDALYALNPWLTAQTETCVRRVRYAQLIDDLGYEGARRTAYAPEIRQLLQRLGTEVGRNILGADVWVQTAMRAIGIGVDRGPAVFDCVWPENYVFADCRFPNEAEAIKAAGGEVWRVERPGYGPINDHPSETALRDWPFDVRIHNVGNLGYLENAVAEAMGCEVP